MQCFRTNNYKNLASEIAVRCTMVINHIHRMDGASVRNICRIKDCNETLNVQHTEIFEIAKEFRQIKNPFGFISGPIKQKRLPRNGATF